MTNVNLRVVAAWAGMGLAMPLVVKMFNIEGNGFETFLWPLHRLQENTTMSSVWHVLAMLLAFLGNGVVYGLLGFGVAKLADRTAEGADGHQ